MSMSNYFAHLKGLWNELTNYRPLPSCSCGALRALVDYQQQEYVMKFLMGLNESYSHICGQILLMDPLPPINKVFSLILQEEHQRGITTSVFIPDAATLVSRSIDVKQYGKTIEKPICSYCKKIGHTKDKCYRLHGFPPGFKFTKPKSDFASANQTSAISS